MYGKDESTSSALSEIEKMVEDVAEKLKGKCRYWSCALQRQNEALANDHNIGMRKFESMIHSRELEASLDAYSNAMQLVDTLGQQIDELIRPKQAEEMNEFAGAGDFIPDLPGTDAPKFDAATEQHVDQESGSCSDCSGIVYRQTNSGKIVPVDQRCGAKITPPCYQPDGDGCAYQIYGDNNDEPIDRCKSCPLGYSDKVRHTVQENKPEEARHE